MDSGLTLGRGARSGSLGPMQTLQKCVDDAVDGTLKQFASAGLGADDLAVTIVDLSATAGLLQADYRGDAPIYPASVVKLFYLAAAHQQMEDGAIADTRELRDALRDMIVDSSNEATGYVLDLLTGVTSGPELEPEALALWNERRNAVNRHFHLRGYPEINASRKTWNDRPYGRDRQAVQQLTPGKNSLTTSATARLLTEIATGNCVSPSRSTQMLELLKRDFADPKRADPQACEFIGAALPSSARLWSKAGYMSVARHDAALVELADGVRMVLVIFTERHSDNKEIIPTAARRLVSQAWPR